MYGNLLPKITILRPKITFYVSEWVIVVCFIRNIIEKTQLRRS